MIPHYRHIVTLIFKFVLFIFLKVGPWGVEALN